MTDVRWHRTRLLAATLSASTFILPGCADGPEALVDGENEVGLVSGKADSAFSECELRKVVDLLNDGATTVETLEAGGLHTRARKNLMAHRDGADGAFGTADDDPFDDPQEVDDVSYVGPVAFGSLIKLVADRCITGASGNIEVVFSPQPYEVSHLSRVRRLIAGAERSIDIAMYSFRDGAIQDELAAAVVRGVQVRFLFEGGNKDRLRPEGSMSAKLEAVGIDVRYINKIMHHKFVIVDGPVDSAVVGPDARLATGSGNWSYSAGTYYDENTIFVEGNAELILRFQREFNHLWLNSRDMVFDASFDHLQTVEISESSIPEDPSVDAIFTSDNFNVSQTSRGATFSVQRGSNAVSDRLVELIESAEVSIRVASGHLRSRPIAEALLARHEKDPDLPIWIYLDSQEFVSRGTHEFQTEKLETCIAAAGSSESARQDCIDKGFLFSFAMADAGIETRFKSYSYRWHYSYAAQMHHKYIIVDDETVATGSYNLSDNAEHNTMENVVFLSWDEHPETVDAFIDNFDTIWDLGADTWDTLISDITEGEGDIPLVWPSIALTWQELSDIKALIREHCSAINSEEYRRAPEKHKTCPR